VQPTCIFFQILIAGLVRNRYTSGGDHPGRPRKTWTKNIHDDLSSLDLGIHEARDLEQNRPLCRLMSLHSATHALVVVDATTVLDFCQPVDGTAASLSGPH